MSQCQLCGGELDPDTHACPQCAQHRAGVRRKTTMPLGSPSTNRNVSARTVRPQTPARSIRSTQSMSNLTGTTGALLKQMVAAAQQGRAHPREDVVIVLDVSGSMDECDMEGWRRLDAAMECLERLIRDKQRSDPDDQIGLVSFSDTAHVAAPLKPLHDASSLLTALHDARGGGSTNLRAALTVAGQELRSDGQADAATVRRIVVLSDGFENVGTATSIADQLKDKDGAIIQSVGVAGDPAAPNRPLLEEIASLIGSERQYRYITNFTSLQRHLTHVSRKLSTTVWPGSGAPQP